MRRVYQKVFITGQPAYFFHGTELQLNTHLQAKHAKVVGGSDGCWKVAIPAYRRILEIEGEHIVREVCPDRYLHAIGIKVISEKDCENLVAKLNNREISFDDLLTI